MKYIKVFDKPFMAKINIMKRAHENRENTLLINTVSPPAVIFGQDIDYSVFKNPKKVDVVRTPFRGGPVFFDENVLLYSITFDIEKYNQNPFNFRYVIKDILENYGYENLEVNKRNDILINGKKFSGGAKYITKDKKLVMLNGFITLHLDYKKAIQSAVYEKHGGLEERAIGLNQCGQKQITMDYLVEQLEIAVEKTFNVKLDPTPYDDDGFVWVQDETFLKRNRR